MRTSPLKMIGIATTLLVLNACTKNDNKNLNRGTLLTKEQYQSHSVTYTYDQKGLVANSDIDHFNPNVRDLMASSFTMKTIV